MRPPRVAATGLLVLLLLMTVGLLAVASPAAAHAEFISASPGPYDIWNTVPASVTVTVSEAVQPGSEALVVTNLSGDRVNVGPVQLSPTDPTTFSVRLLSGIGPSVYTVTWAVVSADDGHFTAGAYYFMISYRDGTLPGQFPRTGPLDIRQPISPVDVALQGANFVGFAVAFGGTILVALLWVPLGSSLEPSERQGPAEGLQAILRFARWGAVLFLAAVAGLWTENLVLLPPTTAAGIVGSTFLLARAFQVALGVSIVGLFTRILTRMKPPAAFAERPWEFLPLIFLGFLVILLEVAASHSATAQGWWPLAPTANAVHLYGAALWVGGLLTILRARRWLRAPTPAAFSRELLALFSRFAFLGAVLVVSAGILLGVVLVGTVDGLFGTPYGWVVLAKGSLLIPMVGLGVWNRRTLRKGATESRPEPVALERLARNVRVEAVLGAVVLVLAGLLVTINPATAPQPKNLNFLLGATNGGLYAIFQMNPFPATPGGYFFQLELYYAGNGTPFFGGGNGTMTFLLEGGNASGVTLPLQGPHDNHYFVDSAVLDQPGTWEIRAHVLGPGGTQVVLTYTVTLHS